MEVMKIIKNVYIGSSSKFAEKCQDLAVNLSDIFNINITRRWWQHYVKDKPEYENHSALDFYKDSQVQMIRELDFRAVKEADLVIILVENEYKLTGALIELGYALALNKIVIVYGKAKKSAMLSSCIHVFDEKQLFEIIKRAF